MYPTVKEGCNRGSYRISLSMNCNQYFRRGKYAALSMILWGYVLTHFRSLFTNVASTVGSLKK